MLLNHKQVTANWQTLLLTYGGTLCVWGLYRYFFHTSVWLEETLIKGIVFSVPLFILPLPGKTQLQTVGITLNNFFSSVYLGIIIGMVLGLAGELGNLIRHSGFQMSSYGLDSGKIGAFLILSLITAFWEQLLFSGYFLEHFKTITKNETVAVVVASLLFSLIHLPVYYFVQHQTGSQILLSFMLMFTLGMGCSIIKLRQRNLIAPIMAQALWGVTIYLFR